MKKIILISALLSLSFLSLTGCVRKDAMTYSDAEIMRARNYIANYEARMDKAQVRMEGCKQTYSQELYRDCRASVYDSLGISYDADKEVSYRLKDEIEEYRQIAIFPLSTE